MWPLPCFTRHASIDTALFYILGCRLNLVFYLPKIYLFVSLEQLQRGDPNGRALCPLFVRLGRPGEHAHPHSQMDRLDGPTGDGPKSTGVGKNSTQK